MKRIATPQQPKFGGVYLRHPRIVGLYGYIRIHRRARLKPNTRIVGGMKAYFNQRAKNERSRKKIPMSRVRHGSPLPRHGL